MIREALLLLSLTHWGWVAHIYVNKFTIIDSDNGLLPGRHQAIIWTNAGTLLIRPLGTNFSEILIEIHIFFDENAFENVWYSGNFASASKMGEKKLSKLI